MTHKDSAVGTEIKCWTGCMMKHARLRSGERSMQHGDIKHARNAGMLRHQEHKSTCQACVEVSYLLKQVCLPLFQNGEYMLRY